MSTPKISFRVPGGAAAAAAAEASDEATGSGVVSQDIATAPGKDRERDPVYGGNLANLGEGVSTGSGSKSTGKHLINLSFLFLATLL